MSGDHNQYQKPTSKDSLQVEGEKHMKIELLLDQIIKQAYQGSIEAAEEIATELIEVYKTMSKREWVGLTDADIAHAMHGNVEGSNMLPYQFARAIEAKLKEKNT
jgi:hypothetical protein